MFVRVASGQDSSVVRPEVYPFFPSNIKRSFEKIPIINKSQICLPQITSTRKVARCWAWFARRETFGEVKGVKPVTTYPGALGSRAKNSRLAVPRSTVVPGRAATTRARNILKAIEQCDGKIYAACPPWIFLSSW